MLNINRCVTAAAEHTWSGVFQWNRLTWVSLCLLPFENWMCGWLCVFRGWRVNTENRNKSIEIKCADGFIIFTLKDRRYAVIYLLTYICTYTVVWLKMTPFQNHTVRLSDTHANTAGMTRRHVYVTQQKTVKLKPKLALITQRDPLGLRLVSAPLVNHSVSACGAVVPRPFSQNCCIFWDNVLICFHNI